MLLLDLLRFDRIDLLFRELLMFVVLPLLEFLPILILFCDYLVLLLLVFPIQLRVPRIRSGRPFDWRQFLRMGRDAGSSGRSHWRRAVVHGKPLLGVIAGRPRMLSLSGYSRDMAATSSRLFLGRGTSVYTAATSVETDAVHPLVYPCVVYVVDDIGVHAIQRRVVEEMSVFPTTTFITITEVSEAVVDSA